MPEEGLKVVELGEDGDRFLVEGTTDPRSARSALEIFLGDQTGSDGEKEAEDLAAVDARADWWWDFDEDGEEDVLRNRHADEPPAGTSLFSGVVFA